VLSVHLHHLLLLLLLLLMSAAAWNVHLRVVFAL
jgi:hypothetical protein